MHFHEWVPRSIEFGADENHILVVFQIMEYKIFGKQLIQVQIGQILMEIYQIYQWDGQYLIQMIEMK